MAAINFSIWEETGFLNHPTNPTIFAKYLTDDSTEPKGLSLKVKENIEPSSPYVSNDDLFSL